METSYLDESEIVNFKNDNSFVFKSQGKNTQIKHF